MTPNTLAKHAAVIAFTLVFAVGCAGTPEKPAEQPAAAAAQPVDPAKAEAEQAIAAAKAALAEADAAGATWRDTGKMIEKAEKLLAEGKSAEAIAEANKALRQSRNALDQHEAEMARLAGAAGGVPASASAPSAPMAAASMVAAPMAAGADNYKVVKGDSLWRIAGKGEIYNNPYQWPLIYKANRDKIKDADLIYPGQVFAIDRTASQADIDAAVRHAKTRGAWSLGTVEESDLQYLGR